MAIVLLGISLLLNGCSNLNTQAATSSNEQSVKIKAGIDEEDLKLNSDKTDAAGNFQKRGEADFAGEISEIIGNEITLKLIKIPEMAQMPAQGQRPAGQQASTEKSKKTEEKSEPRAITGSTDNGFPGGPGGFPGGVGGRESQKSSSGNSSSNKTTRQAQSLVLEYTGEEKTVTIPVGMNISNGRGQSGAAFDTLQKGNVLMVWLNDAGNVENVRFIGGGTT